jgi:hypothetical protein
MIEMAESQTSKQQSSTSPATGSSKTEFACPDCGEMVREGLVRCWNCGGFLRPEVEERFQKIQARPQKIIYSPPTLEEASEDLDAMLAGRPSVAEEAADDEDSGFELAGQALVYREDEEDEEDEDAALEDVDDASATAAAGEGPSQAERGAAAPAMDPGGDALLHLAAQEEMERLKRKFESGNVLEGVRQIRDGFLIDAPKGCRIQVRDEQTGEMRRFTFPSWSRVRISLLDKLEALQKAQAEREARKAAGPQYLSAGVYKRWMSDCHLHTLNPETLKLKADSMTNEFVPVELGFASDSMLMASLPSTKKGGLFGGGKGGESRDDLRNKLLQHFRAGNSVADAPAGEKKVYSADQMVDLRVVQPAASFSESLFAGIPVFGNGRIAVQLPFTGGGEQPRFLSFTLTQFREFADIIGALFSLAEFGRNIGIPLVESFTEHQCQLSGAKVQALNHLPYYQVDPALEVVLAGWQCGACGIVVSEGAREAAKFGGKNAKGIAKAKCPQCAQKFGSNPLYTLPSKAKPATDEDETEGESQATPTDSPAVPQ